MKAHAREVLIVQDAPINDGFPNVTIVPEHLLWSQYAGTY
jgi:hypothetical protein